jgi:hypothetical protein
MSGSNGLNLSSLVWADARNRQMVEGRGGSTEREQQALVIFDQLGELVPPDDLNLLLADPLKPIAGKRPKNSWLALLHSVAWRGTIPGIKARRITWPEGDTGTAYTIPDDIAPGEHKGSGMIDAEHLSADWVSELSTPPVLASLLLIDRINKPKPDAADDGGEGYEHPALDERHAAVLRWLGKPNRRRRAWKRSEIQPEHPAPTDPHHIGPIVEELARLGLVEAESRKPVKIKEAGIAWLEWDRQHPRHEALTLDT